MKENFDRNHHARGWAVRPGDRVPLRRTCAGTTALRQGTLVLIDAPPASSTLKLEDLLAGMCTFCLQYHMGPTPLACSELPKLALLLLLPKKEANRDRQPLYSYLSARRGKL